MAIDGSIHTENTPPPPPLSSLGIVFIYVAAGLTLPPMLVSAHRQQPRPGPGLPRAGEGHSTRAQVQAPRQVRTQGKAEKERKIKT